jgi:hypothetical protein
MGRDNILLYVVTIVLEDPVTYLFRLYILQRVLKWRMFKLTEMQGKWGKIIHAL